MSRQRTFLAAALLAALPGCGGGGEGTTTPSVTSTPPPATVTTVVEQGSINGVPAGAIAWGNFQTFRSGRLEIVIDWTSPANNLDVVLTRGLCNPEQLDAGSCIVIGTAESPTAKPERVVVEHAVDGIFTLFATNRGPATETLSYQILLTHAP